MPLLTTSASTSTPNIGEPNKPLNTSHSSKDSNQIETEDFFEWCCDIATEHQIHDLADNKEDVRHSILNTTTLPTLRATCAFTCFVHNLQRQHHFQLKHDDNNIVNNTELILYILLAWTSILTLLLFKALYFIHINDIKIKFLKPTVHERDYPMDNPN
ncbi:hypothetical protein J6590_074004 [Homalodisca vitripennis]|nr:hypothetical protein J6590_074004 [Homalodisca vitripennis]